MMWSIDETEVAGDDEAFSPDRVQREGAEALVGP